MVQIKAVYRAAIVSLEDIYDLRHAVLREGKPYESARFEVDVYPDTLHFAAKTNSGMVAGCASVATSKWEQLPAWRLRGMATHPEHQHKGVGTLLLTFIESKLQKEPAKVMWCNAREIAFSFYQKNGWQYASDVFEVPGIGPHRKMIRYL